MQLKGKTALITGGGKGLGAAIAKRFVNEGAKVCITGRQKEALEKTASTLTPGMVAICSGDVSNLEDAQRMVAATVEFGGRIDIVVNNAGIDPAGSVVDLDPKVWQKVMDVNLTGPFLVMKAAIPHMIKAGGGSIINIASLGGLRCLPAMPAYASSKAGLIMLTKQVALDYGVHKIRCNVVCPGPTRTKMFEDSLRPLGDVLKKDLDGVFTYATSTTPLRRVASPEEMTGICTHLASDDSTFMTGSVLLVDGGAAVVDVVGATLSSVGIGWGGA
jgi:meso-butanediol dehydrogenase / (S,S)-butanediol dehydrogenase / diacetyl reductase